VKIIKRKRDIIESGIVVILFFIVIVGNKVIDKIPKGTHSLAGTILDIIFFLIYIGCPLWLLYILYRNCR